MPSPMRFIAARLDGSRLLRWSGCLLVLMFLARPAAAQLADAPWPKFGGDLQNTGQSPYGDDGASWQATDVGEAQTGPAIAADGTIYVVGNGTENPRLYALGPDGTQRWTFSFEVLSAPTDQPIVDDDGTVYVGGRDGAGNGVLYAIESDGTEKWQEPFFVEAMPLQATPLLADDGTLYVLTGDFSTGGELHAVDTETGASNWRVDIGYSTAAPTIADDGTIYVGGSEGQVFVVDPAAQEATPLISLDGGVRGLALDTDGMLYASFENAQLAAIDPTTGDTQWSVTTDLSLISPPAIGPDGHLFVGASSEVGGRVYAFDDEGEELWSVDTDGPMPAAPAVTSEGTVFVGFNASGAHQLLALDASDGAQRWAFPTEASLIHAPVVAADGTIYLASGDGLFSILDPRIEINPSQLPTPHAGEDIEMAMVVPEGFQPETRDFYYRPTGAPTYERLELQPTGDGTVVAGTIPGEAVTERGLDFYIVLSDGRMTVTYPQKEPERNPAWLPVQFDQLAPPGTFEPDTYRMISIPAAVEASDLAAVFDDYGAYEPKRWRVLRWDPQAEDYEELPEFGDTPVAPGQAFWVITREGESFTLGEGQATDAAEPHTITLEPGWNQVGNPYAFPVDVASLDLPDDTEIARYDGQEYRYDVQELAPWEGYFMYNASDSPVTVTVPPVEASEEDEDTAQAKSTRGAADYTMRITAQLGDGALRDTENVIGLASEARVGRDRMDYAEAPPVGDHVRLSILEDDERLAGSFKPPRSDGQWWDLEVTASVKEALPTRKRVQVRLHEQGQRPGGHRRYVIDRDAGTAIEVEDGTFDVELDREQPVRRLRVILGTPEFAEAHAEDASLESFTDALHASYPNPFAQSTTVPYQLRTQQRVVIEVYNMLGQRVRTLVDAKQEAGTHEVQWDGRNAQGMPVASGTYVLRMTAGSYEATRKVVFVR